MIPFLQSSKSADYAVCVFEVMFFVFDFLTK